MKRVLVGTFAALLAVLLVASVADAQKRKKGKRKKTDKVPTSEVISQTMGDLKWGMSKDDVMKKFVKEVKDKYRPLIAKTKDGIEEDRLRREANEEIRRIKEGYVEFSGRSTGWDVSFLKGEFAHNNDEAMLVVRDGNSQNFYFFMGGRLWKWYKAFDAAVFPNKKFPAFANAVQRRFGPAKEVQAEVNQGDGARHYLEWQDKKTRLRAVDQTGFYGFYCLVFEEKDTSDKLAKLRPPPEDKGSKRHAMVEAVTSGDDANPDDSPNVVDRITGRLRQTEQAPEETASRGRGRSAKSAKKGGSSLEDEGEESSGSGLRADDDPLNGLGL